MAQVWRHQLKIYAERFRGGIDALIEGCVEENFVAGRDR